MTNRILIIEDEVSIQNVVRRYLEAEGYTVRSEFDGRYGLQTAGSFRPDLVVLDINLPSMDGFEIAAQLRQQSDVYIIMLTARGDEQDRVRGLTVGADDYVVKPFSPRELVARVKAGLRRHQTAVKTESLCFKQVTLNPQTHEVYAGDTLLDLTPTEFQLLLEMMRHAGQILTRQQLLDRVWGSTFMGNDRVVDVYVGQVRRKLEDVTGHSLIATVRGVGYRFMDEPQL